MVFCMDVILPEPILQKYALISILDSYLKTDDFNKALSLYAKTADVDTKLADYLKTSDFNTNIANYIKSSDLTSTLTSYLKTDDFNKTISEYSKTADVDTKLVNYLKISDLSTNEGLMDQSKWSDTAFKALSDLKNTVHSIVASSFVTHELTVTPVSDDVTGTVSAEIHTNNSGITYILFNGDFTTKQVLSENALVNRKIANLSSAESEYVLSIPTDIHFVAGSNGQLDNNKFAVMYEMKLATDGSLIIVSTTGNYVDTGWDIALDGVTLTLNASDVTIAPK